MTAGQDFVKRIGKLGCVLFLAAAVLVTALCLFSGRDPIKGYEPPQDTEYWQTHPQELALELRKSVLPYLEGEPESTVSDSGVTVTMDRTQYAAVRSAVLRYFDSSLVSFEAR